MPLLRGLTAFKNSLNGSKVLRKPLHRGFILSVHYSSSQVPTTKPITPDELTVESNIPIEKRSLTRGLSLNKFEKDFMIFPEYTETEEYEAIKKQIGKVENEFDKALVTTDTSEVFNSKKIAVLLKNDIFQTFVPKEFGGAGFCHKDLLLLSEVLAKDDLSTFVSFNQIQSAASLLLIHGTAEQKAKYLPKIANFECKPAICIEDETHADAEITKVIGVPGQGLKLNGLKTNVINAHFADLFFVFAKRKHENSVVDFFYN